MFGDVWYAATEAAVIAITRGPGRFASAEDIAHCAAFLASDEAALITGETILVDGGLVRT